MPYLTKEQERVKVAMLRPLVKEALSFIADKQLLEKYSSRVATAIVYKRPFGSVFSGIKAEEEQINGISCITFSFNVAFGKRSIERSIIMTIATPHESD